LTTSAPPPRDRPAWLPLAAAALLVPTALAGLTLLWPRPGIEAELTGSAAQALAAAGLAPAEVVFRGRDATITGPAGADGERAVEVVEGVSGVRVARLADGGDGTRGDGSGGDGGGTDPGDGPDLAAGDLRADLRDGDLVLTGEVGSEAERGAVVGAARAKAGSATVVDGLTVAPGATLPGGLDPAAVGRAAGVLTGVAGVDLALTVATGPDGGPVLTLTGAVAAAPDAEAARTALREAVPGGAVDDRLVVGDAPVPVPPDADLDPAGRAALQSEIDALVAAAPITFRPDSPALTPAGARTVERIVALVAAAPGARLQVDGFVATGPGRGQLTAQELSDLRARTVRDALVDGGVPAGRVSTAGRGEGDAPAAGDAGRRVAVTVV
jgi:outer membrane protein OmpA-like peptidoglycan-associated protein